MAKKRYHSKHAQKINRSYKDSLFRFVFAEKKNLLELYNAINGSHYENTEDLEVHTLEDVLYLGVKNDLSFLRIFDHNERKCRSIIYFNDSATLPFYF